MYMYFKEILCIMYMATYGVCKYTGLPARDA